MMDLYRGMMMWMYACRVRDYEKFQKIADKQLEKPYYLRSLENNNDYRYCFARIATENMKIKTAQLTFQGSRMSGSI